MLKVLYMLKLLQQGVDDLIRASIQPQQVLQLGNAGVDEVVGTRNRLPELDRQLDPRIALDLVPVKPLTLPDPFPASRFIVCEAEPSGIPCLV